MPMLSVNGATLDYTDTGSPAGDTSARRPVVLIHGWLGTWESEFGPELAWLSPHYRVLALTRRGYGQSGPKPRTYPRDFYQRDADDVAAWLDALGVADAHIVGYSDGGEVALLLAIARPDLARSVAVWGAVGYFGPEVRARAQRNYPPTWVSDEIRALHGSEHIEHMVLGWVTAMKQIIDGGGDVSLGAADRITCPLLLMLGRGDTLNPVHVGEQYVARTPRGKLAVFECGHPVHREQPDAFRAALWDHLQAAENRPAP